jgi:hypothetical protein
MDETVAKCKTEDKDPLRIFVGAVANEMNRDFYIFHKLPVSRYTNVVIPRLEKLAYVAKAFPRSLACIAYLSSVLWPLLFYPVIILLQVIFTLRHVKLREARITGDVFLTTSNTSFLFSRSSGFQGIHICVSKKLEQFRSPPNSIASVVDYITLSDLVSAFKYAVRALLQLSRSGPLPGAAFQVYAAFSWFLTWSVLNRSAVGLTSVWISNDSDRWAVLVDQLPGDVKKIIVQHGLLSDPPNRAGFRNPTSLPTRLKNIDKIVLFDEDSENKYRSQVIEKDSKTNFIFSDGWLIQTRPDVDDLAAVRVMIIGQRAHEKQECELANYLVETVANSRIFIKPHPGSTFTKYKKYLDCRVVLIDDLYRYPYAEFCICFDFSSLGNLYEKQGAKVIYLKDIKFDWQSKDIIRRQIMSIGYLADGDLQVGDILALEISNDMGLGL